MSEIFRDQCRATEEAGLLDRLADHVEAPSDATWAALVAQAAACDAVRGGYSGMTAWARDLGPRVTRLLEGDRETWGRLLQGMLGADPYGLDHGTGKRLHEASPFRGKLLLAIGGPSSGETYARHARAAVLDALQAAGHAMTSDAGFLVAVDAVALQGAEVVRTRGRA